MARGVVRQPKGCQADDPAQDAVESSETPDSSSPGDDLSHPSNGGIVKPLIGCVRDLTEETVDSFGVQGAERFVLRELLGEGGFGSVYRCSLDEIVQPTVVTEVSDFIPFVTLPTSAPDRQDFAVKVVNARRLALISGCSLEVVCPRVQREIEILNHLGSHARLVRLHHAFFSQETARFFLVTELLRGGDLFSTLVQRGKPFNEHDAHTIFSQIVEAIAYCHSRQVAHRDLKLENCLLEAKDSFLLKVCDYGQSKFFGFEDQAKSLTTSPAYTAPEVKLAVQDDRPYDAYKADVFSLGVILYCILCNAMPGDAGKRLYEKHRAWPGLSPPVRCLIGRLLVATVDLRPQAEEILHDNWFIQCVPTSAAGSPFNDNWGPCENGLCNVCRVRPKQDTKYYLAAFISIQYIIDALQRERASCCDPTLTESEFFWQMRYTDERVVEGDQRVTVAFSQKPDGEGPWQALQDELRRCATEVVSLRVTACRLMQLRGGASRNSGLESAEKELMEVFGAYHPLLSRLISALGSVFQTTRTTGISGGFLSRSELRLRLLLLAAEQLARERGFLATCICQASLCSPPILMALAEIIGARKLLIGEGLGGSPALDILECAGPEPHIVTAATGGLLPALQLAEVPFLESADLSVLARAEQQVLSRHDGVVDQAAVSELYHLLVDLADKVHQLMLIGLMEFFSPPRPSGGGSLPKPSSGSSATPGLSRSRSK